MAFEKQYNTDPDDFSIFGYELSFTLNHFLLSIHREGYTEGQAQDKVDPIELGLSGLLVTVENLEKDAQTLQKIISGMYRDEDML